VESANAAAASQAAAAASAATINLPAIAGRALNFIRAKTDETGLEYRTPAQVRGDLGGTTVGQNLFTSADIAAARAALGATATGSALLTAASAAAARAALGGTTVGQNLFTAADLAASRTALGATATGAALFTAANAAAGRTSLGVLSTLGNPLNLDVGGFIIKSGEGTTSAIGIQNVVFSVAFPNALIGVSVLPITAAATCGSADSPTSTGFQARTFFSTSGSFTPCGYRWIAIGY